MLEHLQTSRISPKHQITLPRSTRGLPGIEEGAVVCALPRAMPLRDGSKLSALVVLTEEELRKREDAIRAREDIPAATKERLIAKLNGRVRQLAVDRQRRVVLPQHFVKMLNLDRDVYMFVNNQSVMIWHPNDWLRYNQDLEEEDADDLML